MSFNNPFGALGGLRDRLPESKEPKADSVTTPSPAAEPAFKPGKGGRTWPRAVVRMERAGRGGKEATVIEQLNLNAAERAEWLKALKAALGCGGSVEGDTIMLQGDHRERLRRVLADRGVKKVIVG